MAYFSQSEVIGIVSRLIHEAQVLRPDYIDRTALVGAFLADPEGQAVANHGWEQVEADHRHAPRGQWRFASKADFVGNMIDWFSAHYGRGNEALTEQFSRVRQGKHWAYKPLPGARRHESSPARAAAPAVDSSKSAVAAAPPAATSLPMTASNGSGATLIFGLERQLQAVLRAQIAQLAPDLTIVDGGRERWNTVGRSDILARDGSGTLVVIELKAGMADDAALTQLLAYMDAFEEEEGRPVRGMLIAGGFSDRTTRAARRMASVQLQRYTYTLRFEEAR